MVKRIVLLAACWGLMGGSVCAQVSTTSLISVWEMDEASGSAVDAFGSNTLTETSGTIDATTGKINGARDFEATADTEYFEIADNADVSMGDIDFTITAWVNLETAGATQQIIVGKDRNAAGDREYNLFYRTTGTTFAFEVFSASNSGTIVSSSTFGTPSTGTWYFIVAWYDATTNTMYISVNDGTANSTAKGTLQASGAAPFRIGARAYATIEQYFDGKIDQVTIWKRVLTSGERTALYNSGNGLAYASWNASGNGLVYPQIIGSLIRPTPWSRFIAQTPIALLEAR